MALSRPAGPPDVVDRDARHDQIERVHLEGQPHHVCGRWKHSIHEAFGCGIPSRHSSGVARLIGATPDVDAEHAALRQAPCSRDQHGPAAAAQVQDTLIAREAKPVEQFLSDQELASP